MENSSYFVVEVNNSNSVNPTHNSLPLPFPPGLLVKVNLILVAETGANLYSYFVTFGAFAGVGFPAVSLNSIGFQSLTPSAEYSITTFSGKLAAHVSL